MGLETIQVPAVDSSAPAGFLARSATVLRRVVTVSGSCANQLQMGCGCDSGLRAQGLQRSLRYDPSGRKLGVPSQKSISAPTIFPHFPVVHFLHRISIV